MTVAVDIHDRISKCQKILETDPNSQIFAALAEAYRKNGELDKAFRICQNGLKIHPSYGSAHVVMAKINMDRGMYDWADAEIRKAIELDGNHRATELLLAEIHIYKGEFVDAIRLLKRLHRSDPNNKQIKKLLDIAQKIPEEQKAISEPTVVMTTKTSEDNADSPDKSSSEPAMTAGRLLQQAIMVEHISGAMLLNDEGLVVASEWTVTLDATTCGASLAAITKSLSKDLVSSYFGSAQSVLIESNEMVFYVVRLEKGMFLFAAESAINLGSLRMRVAALLEKYYQNGSGL